MVKDFYWVLLSVQVSKNCQEEKSLLKKSRTLWVGKMLCSFLSVIPNILLEQQNKMLLWQYFFVVLWLCWNHTPPLAPPSLAKLCSVLAETVIRIISLYFISQCSHPQHSILRSRLGKGFLWSRSWGLCWKKRVRAPYLVPLAISTLF